VGKEGERGEKKKGGFSKNSAYFSCQRGREKPGKPKLIRNFFQSSCTKKGKEEKGGEGEGKRVALILTPSKGFQKKGNSTDKMERLFI